MTGSRRIVAHAFGGPEVLGVEHAPVPEPGAGEVRLRVEAAGVGYTDTIVRRGRYMAYTGGLPVTPGYDVVGTVDAVGPGVTGWAVGDRAADMPVTGSYADHLIRPADTLVPVPDGVSPVAAVDVPLMWMTAWQMLTRAWTPAPGATVLVVGASGAVGRPLVQLARHLGLRVVGTASAGKQDLVRALGAEPVDYAAPDLPGAIRAAAGPVAAAFDAIGGASWQASFDALADGGLLVAYGLQGFLESGAPPAEAAGQMRDLLVGLPERGRGDGTGRRTLFYDILARRGTHPQDYREDAIHLLGLIAAGTVVPPLAETLPLDAAADAHARVGGGSLRHRLVLTPGG